MSHSSIGPDGDHGHSLSRLISETRKLAAENAKFCDLNSKLSEEVKTRRKNENILNEKIQSIQNDLEANKINLKKNHEKCEKQRIIERELNRKLREITEEYEVEREKETGSYFIIKNYY